MAIINGNDSANSLFGTLLADIIRGFDGNDTIEGGNGNNRMTDESCDDGFCGGNGNNWMGAGEGNDMLDSGPATTPST